VSAGQKLWVLIWISSLLLDTSYVLVLYLVTFIYMNASQSVYSSTKDGLPMDADRPTDIQNWNSKSLPQFRHGIPAIYEGESVNRSQMYSYIKRKTYDFRTWKKTFISWHILHQHWYTCSIALPVRRNLQHTREVFFDCCLSHFRTSISTSSSPKRLPRRLFLVDQTDGSH
jgi:hypothetical protein